MPLCLQQSEAKVSEPGFGLQEVWTADSNEDLIRLPIIREIAGFERLTWESVGTASGASRPSPSEAEARRHPQRGGEDGLTARREGCPWPRLDPRDQAPRLRFLRGLREVSPSAEETTAAPPS